MRVSNIKDVCKTRCIVLNENFIRKNLKVVTIIGYQIKMKTSDSNFKLAEVFDKVTQKSYIVPLQSKKFQLS